MQNEPLPLTAYSSEQRQAAVKSIKLSHPTYQEKNINCYYRRNWYRQKNTTILDSGL